MGDFRNCMDVTLGWEGGYVDHPRDPGGATNMGITHITLSAWRGYNVSKAEVKALTKEEAEDIYRARYWNKVRGDELPAGMDLVAFDGAVNSGPRRGAKWLQMALGVTVDGVIGPKTIAAAVAAAKAGDSEDIINTALDARLDFLMRLETWPTFGKGWSNRVADIRANALGMAGMASSGTGAAGTGAAKRPKLPVKVNPWLVVGGIIAAALAAIFGG